MKKSYLFINVSFFFWFLTLIAWIFNNSILSLSSFVLSILFLALYFNQKKVTKMFTKKQNKSVSENTLTTLQPEKLPLKEEQTNVSEPTVSEEKSNTIIARDVIFEGNITANELVHIYGKVIGNITGKDNIVKVMLNGQVTGNITSKELVVNGKVEGECISESISIENNGEIHGIIQYTSLSIKKGGILSGQAKVKNTTPHADKVTILKDKAKQEILEQNKDIVSL